MKKQFSSTLIFSLCALPLMVTQACSNKNKGLENESPRLAKEIQSVSVGRQSTDSIEVRLTTKPESDLKATMSYSGDIAEDQKFFDLSSAGDDYDLKARVKCDAGDPRCEKNLLVFESKNSNYQGNVTLRYNSFYALAVSEILSVQTGNKDPLFADLAQDLIAIKSTGSSHGSRLILSTIDSIGRSFYNYSLFINEGFSSSKIYQFRGEVGSNRATVLQYYVQNGTRSSSANIKELTVLAALSKSSSPNGEEKIRLELSFARGASDAWLDVSQIVVTGVPGGFSPDADAKHLSPSAFDFVL